MGLEGVSLATTNPVSHLPCAYNVYVADANEALVLGDHLSLDAGGIGGGGGNANDCRKLMVRLSLDGNDHCLTGLSH